MTCPPAKRPGVGWCKGDPVAAQRVLQSLERPLELAWLAQAAESNAYELITEAREWVPLRETFNDPGLDETHVYEAALRLRAILVGARSVPDACAVAAGHVDQALALLADLWPHLHHPPPTTAAFLQDHRYTGPLMTMEQFE